MTLYAWARRRHFPRLPPAEARLFRVADDTEVLGHCHWQPDRRRALTVVLLHGLEGSSDGHYMRGMADKAWAQRLQRGTAQPAQLRRYRTPQPRALPLGADRRPARGDAGPGRRRRSAALRLRRLLARRQYRAEARRRTGRRRPQARRRRRRRVAADRAGRVRRRPRAPPERRLPLELPARAARPDAAQGPPVSRRVGYRAAARGSARCGPSTTPTRRRTTALPGRPTTTTAPAPVASSTASPCRRCSSPPMTTRSCRRRRPATRRWRPYPA